MRYYSFHILYTERNVAVCTEYSFAFNYCVEKKLQAILMFIYFEYFHEKVNFFSCGMLNANTVGT